MMIKKFTCLVLSIVFAVLVTACNDTPQGLVLQSPENEATVCLHTEAQQKFLKDNSAIVDLANGTADLSAPQAAAFLWSAAPEAKAFTLRLGENADLSDAKEYKTDAPAAEIYNLKLATEYYWQVIDDAGNSSEIRSFTTEKNGPRNLKVEGVTNVRDLGGYATATGGTVRQGLVFRSGRFNTNYTPTANEITAAGVHTLVTDLGIKTEIDLRDTATLENGSLTESVLGSGVKYYACPMTTNDLLNDNLYQIKAVFELFADAENYPIIFHCSIGTDRTGMIAYLLGALLGVEDSTLQQDYLFSNFGYIGGSRSEKDLITQSYYCALESAPCDNTQAAANYVLQQKIGLSADCIAAIRKNLIAYGN